MEGFIILCREGIDLLENDPKAFLLLTHIALRARRNVLAYSPIPLDINQALIGDHEKIGLTRQEYRTALKRLVQYGLIRFKTFNKGTVATLLNTKIYDINTGDSIYCKNKNFKHEMYIETEKPSKSSIENTRREPPENQHGTNQNTSIHQEISGAKPLTNKETMEKENKQTTTRQGGAVALYSCLNEFEGVKGFELTDNEKLGLMAFPIDRVIKAIDYASHPSVKIKKDLISLLHWHCKKTNPVAAPDESDLQASSIPQHKLAYEYTEFLKECEFLNQYEANIKSISQGIASILEEGGWTTVSLNSNSLETLRGDFSKSKDLIRKRK